MLPSATRSARPPRHRFEAWIGVAIAVAGLITLVPAVRTARSEVAVLGAVETPGEPASAPNAQNGLPTTVDAAVVRITAQGCDGTELGSGVVLARGEVLTARHLVAGASILTVAVNGGSTTASVARVDPAGRDAAILRLVRAEDPAGVAIATVPPAPDAAVTVLGHPRGGTLERSAGHVLAYTTAGALALDGGGVMTLDIPFEPGISGGPVVDGHGALVAIAIGVERRSQTGIALPVADIAALLAGKGDPPPATCG
ncbi:MAG TPA: serine protease [Acidimicrobiales bacterium]|nr:serine protease [Acidimicrobiales bacterium]